MIEILHRNSKDFVRTAGLVKATDTTTRLVWRHGKGTTRSACAGTDDSAVLRVRIFIIVMITSVTKFFHIELACRKGVRQPRVSDKARRLSVMM